MLILLSVGVVSLLLYYRWKRGKPPVE